MAAGDLALRIIITASGSQALAEMGAISMEANRMGHGFGGVGIAMLVASAGLVAFGVASVKAAGDFQQQMLHIAALANIPLPEIKKMGDQVLQLSVQFGQMPVEMAKAMFQVTSALYTGKQAFDILRYSAMLATTGMAPVVEVTKAMIVVMKNYGMDAKTAADEVTRAVSLGRMTMTQYANSIGIVAQKGKQAHVSFLELNASMDVLTSTVFPSAQQAARNLAQLFAQVGVNVDALAGRAQKMGLRFDEVHYKTLPLIDKLQYLIQVTHGNSEELNKLIGGGQYASRVVQALTDHVGMYNQILGLLKTATDNGGAAQKAWDITLQGFNVHMDIAHAMLQTLLITIGNGLIPLIEPLIDKTSILMGNFAIWAQSGHAVDDAFSLMGQYAPVVLPFLAGLGTLILGVLIPAFLGLARAMMLNPLTWLVLGVAGLVAAFVHAYQTSQPFRDAMNGLWAKIQKDVLPALQQFAGYIQTTVIPALQQAGQWIQDNVLPVLTQLANYLTNSVIPAFQNAWGFLQANFIPAMQTLGTTVQLITIPALTALGAYLLMTGVPAILSFGGDIMATVLPALGSFAATIMMTVLPAIGDFLLSAAMMALTLLTGDIPAFLEMTTILWSAVAPALATAASAAWGFTAALLANPITWVVLALLGLGLAFIYAYNNSKPFRDFIDNLWKNSIKALWDNLKKFGDYLKNTFGPVWTDLVNVWNTQILPVLQQLWGALQPLMPVLMAIGVIILAVVIGALMILGVILDAVIRGLAGFIDGLGHVIAGVVQIFTGIVQIISGVVTFVYDFVTGNWGKLGSDLGMIWQGIVNVFQGIWNTITSIFQTAWQTVSGIVMGLIDGIVKFFQGLYNTLVGNSIVPDLIFGIIKFFLLLPIRLLLIIGDLMLKFLKWAGDMLAKGLAWAGDFIKKIPGELAKLPGKAMDAIGGLKDRFLSWSGDLLSKGRDWGLNFVSNVASRLAELPGKSMDAISSLAGKLGKYFGDLARSAWSWGVNIIAGILDGMKSKWNELAGWIGNGLQWVRNLFPHSPVKAGPLVGMEHWGGNMVDNIVSGMVAGAPRIVSAATLMAKSALMPYGSAFSLGAGGSNFALGGYGATASNQGTMNVTVQLDSRVLTQALGVRLAKEIRVQAGVKNK